MLEFFRDCQRWPCCTILYIQSGIAIFSLYSWKHTVDMNISKQIIKSYGKFVILEILNSVKFSIHALMRKMCCLQNETILYYGNYGKTLMYSRTWQQEFCSCPSEQSFVITFPTVQITSEKKVIHHPKDSGETAYSHFITRSQGLRCLRCHRIPGGGRDHAKGRWKDAKKKDYQPPPRLLPSFFPASDWLTGGYHFRHQ